MNGNPVSLKPGDLVIYRGCDLSHWREEVNATNEDSWHVQGFFHYVDKSGPYADYKFDKRDSIGEKLNVNKVQPAIKSKSYIQYTK
jgi:hypothetical protein